MAGMQDPRLLAILKQKVPREDQRAGFPLDNPAGYDQMMSI